jgi:ureidoacrylate peracid hydrolase
MSQTEMEFQIDPSLAALLIVDMQNGFCNETGTLAKSGVNYMPMQSIIPEVKKLIQLCRDSGIPIIWSQLIHFADDVSKRLHIIPSHWDRFGFYPCLNGTWDCEIVNQLKGEILAEDDIIVKHRFSCFYNTTLEVVLKMRGRRLLIVCGVATNYCVESTIRDAHSRDLDVALIKDCTATSDEALYEATLKNVDRVFGRVLSVEELSQVIS